MSVYRPRGGSWIICVSLVLAWVVYTLFGFPRLFNAAHAVPTFRERRFTGLGRQSG
jgi:hypothetical protein